MPTQESTRTNGTLRNGHLGLMYGAADLAAMRAMRDVFDPDGRMNPDKLFPTRRGCGEVRRSLGGSGLPC